MTETRKAFLRWFALRPDTGGSCCSKTHFMVPSSQPMADEYVCERERSWREYVRLRDGDREYPFVKHRMTPAEDLLEL